MIHICCISCSYLIIFAFYVVVNLKYDVADNCSPLPVLGALGLLLLILSSNFESVNFLVKHFIRPASASCSGGVATSKMME